MFRNRSHARGQQRAGHPCFRPQLECLEARTLLDACGSVTAALATLANDLGQAVNDAVHLQGAAVKQDASKISQDVSNVKTQIRNIPGVNLALDISAVANGIQAVAAGLYVTEAGVAVSDTGAGAAVGIPVAVVGVNIAEYGADLTTTAADQFFKDLNNFLSGGQPAQLVSTPPTPAPPPTPGSAVVGTWSGSNTPDYTSGIVFYDLPQKVTLSLNPDGSGSLSVVPFAGSGLAVSFPAGTARGTVGHTYIDEYDAPNGISIYFDFLLKGNSTLSGNLSAANNRTGDATGFSILTLNRQG